MEVPTDNPLSEEQARLYFRDIVLGIEYCELPSWEFLWETWLIKNPVHRSVNNEELGPNKKTYIFLWRRLGWLAKQSLKSH